ncbi:MAG: glycosyltransferase family 39 protein [Bacteroidota bacterium]
MMLSKTETVARLSPWVLFIALFNLLLHLAFYNTLGFHRDELLYFSLGQHPSAGYASVPPFIGLTAWLMIHILGYSLLAARIIPILLSGLLVILSASIARELHGRAYAQVLTSLAIVAAPFNLRSFFLFMPVCFDIFFWTLIFWLTLKWINTKKDKYLILLGLAAGTGMMNKYLVALELLGILTALLLSPYRTIFAKRAFYLAICIAFLVFLPNLTWQFSNGLPVLTHMKALQGSQLVHVSRITFLTDQLLIGALSVLLTIPGILFLCFGKIMKPYRFMITAGIVVMLLLVIARGKSYYSLGLFPLLIAAGGVYWENSLKRKFSRALLPLLIVVVTIPLIPVGLPVLRADKLARYFAWMKDNLGLGISVRWETGRYHELPQDYADMLGWDEIAFQTARGWQQIPDKRHAMIYAQNYGQAGAVMVLGKKYGLPEPACFAESFYYWLPRNPPYEITTLIYINDVMGDDVKNLFGTIRKIGQVDTPMARESGTSVWMCSEPHTSFNEFWIKRTRMVMSPFE